MDAPYVERVVTAIVAANPRHAIELLDDWGQAHGYARLAEQVLVPCLNLFSERYSNTNESPLARGYVAAKVAEQCMQTIAEQAPPDDAAPTRPRIVIGNIEDDYHGLGRRIVCSFLRCDGWDVIDLGDDVLAPVFVDKALEHDCSDC